MKSRRENGPKWLLRLMPVLGIASVFLPWNGPQNYLRVLSGWSYPRLLGASMDVDKAFLAAYPGVKSFFGTNALLTFCCFVVGILLALQLLLVVASALCKPARGDKLLMISAVPGVAQGLVAMLMIGQTLTGNNASASELGERIYQVTPGMLALLAQGVLTLVSALLLRRARLENTHMAMRMSKLEKRENLKGFLFISPYLIGFFCFIAYPMLYSAYTSFTYYNITSMQKWYGVSNFVNLFTKDDFFWKSLGNTLYYVVVSVPAIIVISMILALLMNMRVRFMAFFRTVYYLPTVLSGVAIYLLWQWILDPTNGLLNNGLALLGIHGPAWLYDPKWTKPALIIMRLWNTGATMLLLLAALQSVPQDLYEAASIDGASPGRKFFSVTLPMISPTLFFVLVTGVSGAFQVYDSAYLMVKNGGPSKSLLFYNLYLFNTAFETQSMGTASAMAWILFVIIMLITVVQTAGSKHWVHYEGGAEK